MPLPPPQPLRVAECAACGQLFALNAAEGVVSCPACDAPVEVAALKVVDLRVAEPLEIRIEPDPAPPADTAIPPRDAEPVVPDTEPAPTATPGVADWLLRDTVTASDTPGSDAAATDRSEAAEEPAKPTPSLSESLGWSKENWRITDADDEEEAPSPDPAADGPPSDEFTLDFAGTPLSERLDADEDEDEPDHVSVSGNDAALAGSASALGWLRPMALAAAFIGVAGAVGYFVFLSGESDGLTASAQRERLADVVGADDANEESDASSGIADEPTGPIETSDPSAAPVQPAAFVADVEEATTDETEPASDPFAVLDRPVAETEPSEPAVEDRYSEAEVEEPNAFEAALDELGPLPGPPPNNDAPATDEYSEQPVTFEAPAPSVPAPAALGLVNAPTYTPDELLEAVQNGESARRGFVAGTIDDPDQVSAMGAQYATLCRLAQVLTLYEAGESRLPSSNPGLEAVDIYRRLFRGGRARVESGRIASQWMGWTGRPHGGVFFSGIPGGVKAAGQLVRYDFEVGADRIAVVMEKPFNLTRLMNGLAQEIGVIGVIVEQPSQWLAGYDGPDERVVWARKTIPLPRAESP